MRRTATSLIAAVAALLAAVAALLAAPAGAEKPAPASPALWRISDADSSVYLFGTFGALPEGATWRSRALAGAIDASESLWFEAPVGEPDAAAAAEKVFAAKGKLSEGRTLSSMLTAERRDALAAIAQTISTPMTSIDPLRPWAAFVVLSAQIHAGDGVNIAEGADAALMNEARSRDRPLHYFDTIEDSLRTLTVMPEKEQLALVSFLIDDWGRQKNGAHDAYAAWRSGDLAATDAALNAPMRAAAPAVYKRLVDDKIAQLSGEIAAILDRNETAFIALNAGYVAGDGALPEALAARGLKVERIDAAAKAAAHIDLRDF